MRVDRATAAREAAERIAAWDRSRPDQFRDMTIHAVAEAREAFREGPEGELPARGTDPLYEALEALAQEADASPEGVEAACQRVLALAGSADRAETREGRVAQDRAAEDPTGGDVPPVHVVGGMRTVAADTESPPLHRADPLDEEA